MAVFPLTSSAAFTSGFSFFTKLNATGSQLVYSTLMPGVSPDSIAVDAQGSLIFVGDGDTGFPATPGAYQSKYPIIPNAYVDDRTVAGKLNASGSALIWGTYVSDG